MAVALAEAPEAWLAAIRSYAGGIAADPLPPKIAKGKQHTALVSFAGTMRRRGAEFPVIFAALMEMNATQCSEPGPEGNIRKIAESISKKPAGKASWTYLNGLAESADESGTPPLNDEDAPKAAKQVPKKNQIKLPISTDALTIFGKEFAEQAAVITDLLYSGVTVFAGRPKVGKSWLTLMIALAVALGRMLLGRFNVERPGRVVYVALEEPQKRTHTRLRKLLCESDVALSNLHFLYSLDPLMTGGLYQLDAYLEKNPASLMVIDTLLAVVRSSSKRDVMRSDYEEVNVLRQLAEKHDVAIVVVHHLRKMGAEYGLDAVSGTSGVTAAADAIWTLQRKSGDCLLEVTGREMEEKTYTLKFNDEPFGWALTGEGEQAKMSEERLEILELLRDESPLKPVKIAAQLRKNACTTRRLLQKLLKNGDVCRNQDGGYSAVTVNGVNGTSEVSGNK